MQAVQTTVCLALALPTAHVQGARPLFGPRASWPVLLLRGCCGAVALILGWTAALYLPLAESVRLVHAAHGLPAEVQWAAARWGWL